MKKVAAFTIGLIISYFHWSGIFVGGALVGFFAKNTKLAVVYGFLFGLITWLLFAVYMALAGMLNKYLSMEILFCMSALLPMVASTFSASLRIFVE
ncbi:hypothetical protein DRO97_00890 [Archaeoglobales archaeon]|nr:MAG: hypothetical protein DRO97_00890 [Archaeoglobales archaeon]